MNKGQSSETPKITRIIAALFLVAGTCIGGGMLALPVATGVSGFLPSIVMMVLCWVSMTATALLLLEVSMWLKEGAHIITMTSTILGAPARALSWCLYLFICYASLIAYTAAGGLQLSLVAQNYLGMAPSKELGALVFILLFGGVIYLGSRTVGRVNSILFIAMILAYLGLVDMGITEIKPELLLARHWAGSVIAIPLLLTAFSFQTMVPSLTPYLKSHIKGLRIAIVGGTFLTFLIYVVWQTLILGIVPIEGEHGLAMALALGEPATQFLREHVNGKWVYIISEYFSFFAIITSFLGIAFGLYDFLADGLKIEKNHNGKVILGLLIVVPTLISAVYFKRIFLVALEASGGFGDTVLNGMIPVLMVWWGRYRLGLSKQGDYRLIGGKPMLVLLFAFFAGALVLSLAIQTGQLAELYAPYEVPVHNLESISE